MTTHRRSGNPFKLFVSVAVAASFSLFAHTHARAQEKGWPNGETESEAGQVLSRKFDEYGHVGSCDHGARLDNFAITLQENPNLVGFVIAYGAQGEGSGSGNFRLRITKDYLVTGRGIDPERIRTIYGGRYKNLTETATELWVAPPGAEPPQPTRYGNEAADFKGKFVEQGVWDGIPYGDYESLGPPMGDVGLANFADALRLQPEARAYIVVYNNERSTPGAWRRVANSKLDSLQNDYGIKGDRIKLIFGGYQKEAKLQLWILPADAPPPVEEAKQEPRLTKALQLGTIASYMLANKENQQWVYKGVAEELRNDKTLRAYIIIRSEFLGTKEAEESASVEEETEVSEGAPAEPAVEQAVEDAAEQTPPAEEPQEVNPQLLVEKWKQDLLKEYGINEERLVVIVAPALDEFNVGTMEAWIVPKDAAPPDPYVAEELEEELPASEEETAETTP